MKGSTVREVRAYIEDVARTKDIPVEQAAREVTEQYTMVCFLGMWDNPDAEVLVPDDMPVFGQNQSAIKVYTII